MGRKRKQRRQSHGSAWHWKQTDCWYYTLPGSKKRMPLFDERGQRIRGLENQEAAKRALARVQIAGDADGTPPQGEWHVARVCSEYLQYCERGANRTISPGDRSLTACFLNDLCVYCGALPVAQLKKGHISAWLESHPSWRSPATHRGALAIVQAAFNRAEEMFSLVNPLKGLKRPVARPRLQSFAPDDEKSPLRSLRTLLSQFPVRGDPHRPAALL